MNLILLYFVLFYLIIFYFFSLLQISFVVDYTYEPEDYKRDFRIAIGVLSALGVIYAGYKTWCWSKRSGRPSMDFATIANFFFFCAGSLANVFFVVTFGMAFYWFIFFKVNLIRKLPE